MPASSPTPDLTAVLEQLPELDLASRVRLAKRVAHRADLPIPVALALAFDRIAVADPLLRYSPVLRDEDLIRVVEETSHEHHLAIAMRPEVSPSVTAMLVEMSDREVMAQLLRNPGAMFTEYVFRRLVAASRHAEPLRAPILSRRELTMEMAQDLSRWVAPDLRRRIADRFGPEAVVSFVEPGAHANLESHRPAMPGPSVPALRPRGHPLIDAIRRKDRPMVERALAEMTGLPRFAVARILTDPGAEALAVVFRALALKRRLFMALYDLLHDRQTRPRGMAADAFRNAMLYFNRLRSPQALGILEGWRKAPIAVWQSGCTWTGRSWLGPGDRAA